MMNKTISDTLNELMANARLNSSALARATGLPATTIKRLRNSTQCNPTLATLEPIANYFKISINELLGKHLITTENAATLPLLPWSALPATSNNKKDYPRIATELNLPKGSYALPIETDDLHPFSKDGVILVDCERAPKSFDYLVVMKKSSQVAVIKKLIIEDNTQYLKSLVTGIQLTPFTEGYQLLGVIVQYKLNSSL